MPQLVSERTTWPTEIDTVADQVQHPSVRCAGAETHDIDISGGKILRQVDDVSADPARNGLEELADVEADLHARLR